MPSLLSNLIKIKALLIGPASGIVPVDLIFQAFNGRIVRGHALAPGSESLSIETIRLAVHCAPSIWNCTSS
jgi:hypothetical protein